MGARLWRRLRQAVEAARTLGSVSDLIEIMTEGLKKLDVKAVREAANKARDVSAMLSDETANKVSDAIAAARAAARKLVKAGDAAAVAIDYEAIKTLTEARTAFLDVGEVNEVVAPDAEARTIEVAPELETALTYPADTGPAAPPMPELELAKAEGE